MTNITDLIIHEFKSIAAVEIDLPEQDSTSYSNPWATKEPERANTSFFAAYHFPWRSLDL